MKAASLARAACEPRGAEGSREHRALSPAPGAALSWQEDRKPAVLLILAALLPCLQRLLGANAPGPGGIGPSWEFAPVLRLFGTALIVFGLVPAAVIVLGFRERPARYGLAWGDAKSGIRLVALLLPIITLLLLLPASRQPELRQLYPLDRRALASGALLVQLELARAALFYPAWEFFFRGFLLFGLRARLGDRLAVCVQVVPSCLWHLGLPMGELLASIPGGILFGALALRTRSVIWPWLLHLLIGIALDLLIVLSHPAAPALASARPAVIP